MDSEFCKAFQQKFKTCLAQTKLVLFANIYDTIKFLVLISLIHLL